MMEDTDMRKYPFSGRKMANPSNPNHTRSTRFGRHLLHRIADISRRKGFSSQSEFIRYAVRKELDHQSQLLYNPQINKEDDA